MDGIKAGNKLYPMQAASCPNFAFLGGRYSVPKLVEVQKSRGGGVDFGHEEVDMNVKDGTKCALGKLNEIGQVSSVSVRPQTGANSCPCLDQI